MAVLDRLEVRLFGRPAVRTEAGWSEPPSGTAAAIAPYLAFQGGRVGRGDLHLALAARQLDVAEDLTRRALTIALHGDEEPVGALGDVIAACVPAGLPAATRRRRRTASRR